MLHYPAYFFLNQFTKQPWFQDSSAEIIMFLWDFTIFFGFTVLDKK